MTDSAEGIILRTRPLTETSLIIHWLTREFGRVATVAKGARRPRSPFAGKLDLFYECAFSFQRSRRSDLHTLREVGLRETHPMLRQDLARLQQAAYAAALVEQTTETDTPLADVYTLMAELLDYLGAQPARPRNVFAFELKLLDLLGQAPNPEETRLGAEGRRLLVSLTETPWEQLTTLKASSAQVRSLQQFLHGFLIFHLGRIPRNRAAALAG